ncbi:MULTISPECIES: DUF6304 family protein [unclassified Streptomyces]|uniref:DUF6304 family protein n=1 Tax=unclassified Streptomyces TaxID=2593676 RepID=UPI000DDACE43|nr:MULTISPECIES: DUF6304 family protein [unclassified Streptomyces]QZZ31073.1 hypothetical protein A7X85_36865 [Streptomyces sp. ST1015]
MRYWPGHYTDRHGRETVVFVSDGSDIRTTIRGVLFEGDTMDDLGALSGEPPAEGFTFREGGLYDCLLEWSEPLPLIVEGDGTRAGTLHCTLQLGDLAGSALADQDFRAVLHHAGHDYPADGCDDFEAALHEIQRTLPSGVRIKACVSCAWSDYPPGACALMGDLACFRDAKDAYLRVTGKQGPNGIFACLDQRSGFVQETWLCEQFENRVGDVGYRGAFPAPRWR